MDGQQRLLHQVFHVVGLLRHAAAEIGAQVRGQRAEELPVQRGVAGLGGEELAAQPFFRGEGLLVGVHAVAAAQGRRGREGDAHCAWVHQRVQGVLLRAIQ